MRRALVIMCAAVALGACADPGEGGAAADVAVDTGGSSNDAGGSDAGHADVAGSDAADSDPISADAGGTDAGGDADAAPPPTLYAARSYGPLEPWGDPIADYLTAGHAHVGGWAFFRGIHDLAVWHGRLYLGYGDADKNLGRVIPIAIRSYGSPDDAQPATEFETQEEQIDHYREVGGALVIPGVDATEDAWLGNMYVRPAGGDWFKSRTVAEGVHVHDAAGWDGAMWAVGSGASPDEWTAGDIYTHLWRSDDGGESFAIVDRWHNLGEGDARWVWLLPAGDSLWVFGYRINAQGQLADTLNGRLPGGSSGPVDKVADDHPLRWVYALHSAVAPDGTGLLVGVNVQPGVPELVRRLYAVTPGGDVKIVEGIGDVSILDIFPVAETGETVLLVRDGALWGDAPEGAKVRVLVTKDLAEFTELLVLDNTPGFESVAAWEGGIYLGRTDGIISRSLGD